MYHLSVPLMLNPRFERDFDSFLSRCLAVGVDRIFLCAAACTASETERAESLRLLRRYLPKIEEAGIEAAVWIHSLGHGAVLRSESGAEETVNTLTLIRDLDGNFCGESYCPADPAFADRFGAWLKELVCVGARMIMLDDDYRLSFRGIGHSCACPYHMAALAKELGEPITTEMVKEKLSDPHPNRYRDAWLKVQGDSLLSLAKHLRAAIDSIDPSVRLGHCAVLSTWDIDGVDSMTLSRAFAGQTRPFFRYIGAPYWAATRAFDHMRLSYVCEYERLQQFWCKDSDIERFCEGDTYPRPRETVSAAYLEGFDTAMRVAGESDGILKYLFDYTSSPQYETGYYDAHRRHLPLYNALQAHFNGKRAVGVTVIAPMKTLALSDDPGEAYENRAVPAALRFACDCGLPIRYEGGEEGVILFGDAATLVDEAQLTHGTVLDLTAARILTQRGFDVGLQAIGESIRPYAEYFPSEDEDVSLSGGDWYDITPSDKGTVLSYLRHGNKCSPAAYSYENSEGKRFLVYAFKAQSSYEKDAFEHGVFRSACRARQVKDQLPYLTRRPLSLSCRYAPNLYVQAKEDDLSLSVALWNFSEDTLYEETVSLPPNAKSVDFAVGGGRLSEGQVHLDPIPPFGMTAFTLVK